MNRVRAFRLAILVVFSATFILASNADQEMPLSEYWTRTGLKVKVLEKIITERICRQSERAFMGCIGALGSLLPDDLKLRPKSLIQDRQLIVKDLGSVAIVKDTPITLSNAAEMVQTLKARRKSERVEWTKLLYHPTFFFEGLLSAFKPYVESSIHEAEKTARAYNTFLEDFYDPHSYVIPTAYLEKESESSFEQFVGIGIQLARIGSYPLVQSIFEGGPAERGGLKRNDIILKINGEPTMRSSFDDTLKKLKGQPGSKVELTLWRDHREITISLRRESLDRTNFETRVLEKDSKKFIYLRIGSFMKQTLCSELQTALSVAPEADGVVLDLRDNGGGMLDAAVCVASAFLPPEQTVVTVKDFDGSVEILTTYGAPLTKLPLVVLVNSDSASASEIVAGALQDHGRAWVVGERTWGKGSVQQSETWAWNDQVLLFRTVARYYLPSGRSVQLNGVKPDVSVDDSETSLRERDLSGSVLPAEGKVPTWELQPTLKTCLEEKKKSLKSDDQLGVAEGLLACAAGD